MAILNILKGNPKITQKALAEKIGKSERTVKTRTVECRKKVLSEGRTESVTASGKFLLKQNRQRKTELV